MKLHLMLLLVGFVMVLHCSNGGGVTGNPMAGGGVIGNPYEGAFTFADTTKVKVVYTTDNPFDSNPRIFEMFKPQGSAEARVGDEQNYASIDSSTIKRFRFSGCGVLNISDWSMNNMILYKWTIAGICSVQVQIVEDSDTSSWSSPFIVTVR